MTSSPNPLAERIRELLDAVGSPSAEHSQLFLSLEGSPQRVAADLVQTAEAAD